MAVRVTEGGVKINSITCVRFEESSRVWHVDCASKNAEVTIMGPNEIHFWVGDETTNAGPNRAAPTIVHLDSVPDDWWLLMDGGRYSWVIAALAPFDENDVQWKAGG